MDDERGMGAYPKYPAGAAREGQPPRPTGVPPSTTMATWALVLAILPGPVFWMVSIGLGIAVLRRSKDGFDHGKRRVIVGFVIIAVWVLVLIAVVAVDIAGDPERDTSGAVVAGGTVTILDIKTGDCLAEDIPDDVEVATVELTPCDSTHVLEAYATFTLADADWPGQDEIDRLAEGGCVKRFESYVGGPYDDSEIELVYLRPFEVGWSRDRGVTCFLTTGGQRTGSLKDSAPSNPA